MKTKFILAGIVLSTMISITLHSLHKERETRDALNLMNIEALAYNESTDAICVGTGSVDCPTNHVKVLYYR